MLIKLKRILKFGWHSFSRSKGLGLQVIFIMGTAVFFILLLFLSGGAGQVLFNEIAKKVDISVYFKSDASEQEILQIKNRLLLLSDEVKSIDYVSKEMALEIFKADHQDDEFYLKAIEEAKENPFLPHLNIYSDNPSYYGKVSDFLKEPAMEDMVASISYEQPKNKQAIIRLSEITKTVKTVGVAVVVFLGFLIIIVTSNIIKLTFIILKDEIGTMKLVGASNWFIRVPFMVQTFFYGLFAVFIIDIFSGASLYFLSGRVLRWFSNFNFFAYFVNNFFIIFIFQLVFVVLFGLVSALLAMRKHLKI